MKQNLLDNFPKTITPMVNMALELGVNYQEFDALIKQIFIQESRSILTLRNRKSTDAAISIISGLSRTNVSKLTAGPNLVDNKPWISLPAKVVAHWLFKDLNKIIPYSSIKKPEELEVDFVTLSKEVTTEKSPKTILNELLRLNYIKVIDGNVSLQVFDEEDSKNTDKMLQIKEFSDNMQAHSLAGVNNIMSNKNVSFLEQSIKVDGIHENSTRFLSGRSAEIWREASKTLIDKAQPISNKEEKQGGQHKLTLGVYCYYK